MLGNKISAPDLNVRLRLLSFIELYDFSFLQAGQLHNIH